MQIRGSGLQLFDILKNMASLISGLNTIRLQLASLASHKSSDIPGITATGLNVTKQVDSILVLC